MRLNFGRNVHNLIHRLNESVTPQGQHGRLSAKDAGLPVSRGELLIFTKELEKGFKDITEDLEKIRREIGR